MDQILEKLFGRNTLLADQYAEYLRQLSESFVYSDDIRGLFNPRTARPMSWTDSDILFSLAPAAACLGLTDKITQLLGQNPEQDRRKSFSGTVLGQAVRQNDLQFIRDLMDHIHFNELEVLLVVPRAILFAQKDVLKLLFDYGSNLTTRKFCLVSLRYAAQAENYEAALFCMDYANKNKILIALELVLILEDAVKHGQL
jgi:hypothetical protein